MRFRIAALIVGAACLFWLSIEDNSLNGVFMFAVLISGLTATRLAYSPTRVSWIVRYRQVVAGGLGGILTPITALVLMALKNGLHLHTTPEYTTNQLAFVLRSMPIWALAGAIVGLGWHFAQK